MRAFTPYSIVLSLGVFSLGLIGGCASSGPQVTHHWVSQDKVAGSVYRQDVAACSATGEAVQNSTSAEFTAYQKCMNERGYVLVASRDIGEAGRE